MNKRRGLGRGLGALFPGTAEGALRESVVPIDVDDISPNPHQPRVHFDSADLESLAQSIRAHGLLSPIIVRPSAQGPRRYELVAGERRWRAARLAGLTTVPGFVREAAGVQSIELALIENLQRTDLNAIEEASGFRQLIEDHDYSQDALAKIVGRSRPAISNALRLLTLPEAVQALIRDGQLSGGHGRALAGLPAPAAQKLGLVAAARGLSVREVERLCAQALAARSDQPRRRASSRLSPELADVENRLRFALATRVSLRPGPRGGSIEIRYADDDELARIVDRICPFE